MSDLADRLRRIRLRLRATSPFFSTLALFVDVQLDASVAAFATDGERILLHPDLAASQSDRELEGIVLHALLHAALLHPVRRGHREAERWNLAADHVVVNLLAEQGFAAHPLGLRPERRYRGLRVEEIYALLPEDAAIDPRLRDLLEPPAGAAATTRRQRLEVKWRDALQQARSVDGRFQHGRQASLGERLLSEAQASVPWQEQLWDRLVRTPVDFAGFDRRMIPRGLYLEALEAEAVYAQVALDTSGSVSASLLGRFVAELMAITATYPHLEGHLFYADAELDGPHVLRRGWTPPPMGGGGTSFLPFFAWVDEHVDPARPDLLVYFTDGHGAFPRRAPERDVVWVVPAGGLPSDRFPFGDVVRLPEVA